MFGGEEIAHSERALRILETSHPPTVYVPPENLAPGCVEPASGVSFCGWKGEAIYLDVVAGGRRAERAAW